MPIHHQITNYNCQGEDDSHTRKREQNGSQHYETDTTHDTSGTFRKDHVQGRGKRKKEHMGGLQEKGRGPI